MVVGVHRPTQLVIDRAALRHNIHAEVERLDQGCELFMVVKANGYGHGAIQVAQAAKDAGATGFCVAILDEALELRAAGFNEPILILGVTSPADAPLMAAERISTTVAATDWLADAQAYLALAEPTAEPLHVHLGLDTGMGRIGFRTVDELTTAIDFLESHQSTLDFEGIFTHFSTADSPDDHYFKQQVAKWHTLTDNLPHRPRYVHVSNSATSLWHAACNDNMVRFGVSGYGLNPSGTAIEAPYALQSALSLTSELVFTKKIAAGDSVGYGATYTAEQDEWVGTVPIGYADGYERRLQGFHVLIDGQACEIIGRVCMDQLMVRLPHDYSRGTTVTLVGQDHGAEVTLQDVADYCGTIHYEIACGFTSRLPRRYLN
ncbi:alanine racemase [Levilactobacillus parabrevis]|uniref:Alanine racemase n=1 Tax=Levilactobacillus parabrevis ATCC 53295 TaxID=1267003 RepID=A0A0R1GHW9_9LACO|nr:alanine racemase [Levilactobacillus parabrevis]KRK33497.1 alanine racemase [Levilactobacillus parabrevis ATCC 53295]KRO04455.1 alanine racemase [Levilactobacillus parabrevis]